MKMLITVALVLAASSPSFGQSFGYSVTDNDQSSSVFPQQFYKINIITGETKYLGDLLVDRNNDNAYDLSGNSGTGERVMREYEGLASINGVLYGLARMSLGVGGFPALCNTGQDPITGTSSDLRILRYNGPQQIVPTPANRVPEPVELLT